MNSISSVRSNNSPSVCTKLLSHRKYINFQQIKSPISGVICWNAWEYFLFIQYLHSRVPSETIMSVFVRKIVSYHWPDGSPSHGLATDGAGSNEKWWTCCTQHKTIDNRSPIPNIKSRSFKLYEIQDRGAESIRGIDRITVRSATLSNHSSYRYYVLPEGRLAHRGILDHKRWKSEIR
jgi:hypothetical protein